MRISVGPVDREASNDSNNEREKKIKLVDVGNSSEEHSNVESPESKQASFATAEGEEHTAKRFYHQHHGPVDEERSNGSSTKREEKNFKPIEVEDSPEEKSDLEYPVSKEASFSVTEGEEDTAKRFYCQHHKAIKKLLPLQLPGSYKTFQSFLQEVFPNNKAVSGSPIEAAGVNSSLAVSRMRAFLSVAFPPPIVGSLATEHVQAAEQGEHFPQFSHISGSTIKYEICILHQRWAIENHEKHHKLKAKQVTIQGILDGTAILSFSGIVQAEEHSRSIFYSGKATNENEGPFYRKDAEQGSKKHNDILQGSFKVGKTSGTGKKTDQPLQNVRCCYLWDPEVVKNFANDDGIRRQTAKMLFQREISAGNITCIKAFPGHESCQEYKTWKTCRPIDAHDITHKSHSSSRSAYVPLAQVIVVHGKEVQVTGGIKSLDPPCFRRCPIVRRSSIHLLKLREADARTKGHS